MLEAHGIRYVVDRSDIVNVDHTNPKYRQNTISSTDREKFYIFFFGWRNDLNFTQTLKLNKLRSYGGLLVAGPKYVSPEVLKNICNIYLMRFMVSHLLYCHVLKIFECKRDSNAGKVSNFLLTKMLTLFAFFVRESHFTSI